MKAIFPTYNEDKKYLDKIADINVKPVFVMGAHRSGTTFIYDSIARCFPLANLDLYHIFFYERMLANYLSNKEAADRQWFNRYIQHLGIKNRGLDNFPVTDDMVEEYSWVLAKQNKVLPATRTNAINRKRLQEACQKILYCTPQAKGILLKNPFDFTNANTLLQFFPQAKFVFVRRRPSEIFNSTLNAYLKMRRPHPFFSLMRNTQPVVARFVVKRVANAMRRMSEDRFLEKLSENVHKNLKKDLLKARESIEYLPNDRYVIVNYEDFNREPANQLHEIQATLDLEFTTPPGDIAPKPRKTELLDITRQYAKTIDVCTL